MASTSSEPPSKRLKTASSSTIDIDEVDDRIVEFCSERRSTKEIMQGLELAGDVVNGAINRLVFKEYKLQLYGTKASLTFLRTSEKFQENHKKLETEAEFQVYKKIEEVGNKGVWTKTLRSQVGIEQAEFNKTLKKLEQKNLIKSVHSIQAPKRKMMMLYEISPDVSLTGGIFHHTEGNLDVEFVERLCQAARMLVAKGAKKAAKAHPDDPVLKIKASLVDASQMKEMIQAYQISHDPLSDSDVTAILNLLVYDGILEDHEVEEVEGEKITKYMERTTAVVTNGIMSTPCGVCPVFDECEEGNVVSPSKCKYLDEW